MSRRTRPRRRVRGVDLALLAVAAPRYALLTIRMAGAMLRQVRRWEHRGRFARIASLLGCRPAQLRRCLLGLPVSTRAAARILAAATPSTGRSGAGRDAAGGRGGV